MIKTQLATYEGSQIRNHFSLEARTKGSENSREKEFESGLLVGGKLGLKIRKKILLRLYFLK